MTMTVYIKNQRLSGDGDCSQFTNCPIERHGVMPYMFGSRCESSLHKILMGLCGMGPEGSGGAQMAQYGTPPSTMLNNEPVHNISKRRCHFLMTHSKSKYLVNPLMQQRTKYNRHFTKEDRTRQKESQAIINSQ
jgi:hypothetical protein